MKTAALLPTPGDPYLIEHWLRNYEQTWMGEVDELRVLINMQPIPEVRQWIKDRVEERDGIYMESPEQVPYGHGYALRLLVDSTDADTIMLCEDDCRVRYRGAVQQRFDRIERGEADVIGGPRTSMTPGIHVACAARWSPVQCDEDGGHGYGMWPAFVFARRECLLATDQNYGVRAWSKGEYVEPVDWVCPSDDTDCADTFGWAAIQLRAKFNVVPDVQFKGPDQWQSWLDRGKDIPWFHIGSLSSSHNLCAGTEAELMDAGEVGPGSGEEKEWGNRLYWWWRCFTTTQDELPEYIGPYGQGWSQIKNTKGVRQEAIEQWGNVADRLVTWNEDTI